ncbi:uncharacterized protein LOC111058059 [Nilaparvata lugens]|uniref:uncharacterized protein LOC111058059 n=1 Tax=Nilaparvata lugens TaxID=108931 RepID=UPI00193E4064|nr:uncharacterized protein LOC111058059 [Nilaparvata lugens]
MRSLDRLLELEKERKERWEAFQRSSAQLLEACSALENAQKRPREEEVPLPPQKRQRSDEPTPARTQPELNSAGTLPATQPELRRSARLAAKRPINYNETVLSLQGRPTPQKRRRPNPDHHIIEEQQKEEEQRLQQLQSELQAEQLLQEQPQQQDELHGHEPGTIMWGRLGKLPHIPCVVSPDTTGHHFDVKVCAKRVERRQNVMWLDRSGRHSWVGASALTPFNPLTADGRVEPYEALKATILASKPKSAAKKAAPRRPRRASSLAVSLAWGIGEALKLMCLPNAERLANLLGQ